MKELLNSLQLRVHEKTYIKDPESSDLGKKIIKYSIILIDQLGFEAFTFKKLGLQINSNESSVYRYFENKHKLLLYLSAWYWAWLEYQIVLATYSIANPAEKLNKMIELISQKVELDNRFDHINEKKLSSIVINEFSKSFLTKEVDQENKEGYFSVYKRLIGRFSVAISDVDSSYPFPASLASTIVEGSLHQRFLKEHFPKITNCNDKETTILFFQDLINKTLVQKS
ncbi:MAG: TetR/AcrR family transcriptional regulator [Flavobacteriaceae bacterium]|nr:TetR/AcrR family transcriptional regulator [Flavobacteriaceae bacterium]